MRVAGPLARGLAASARRRFAGVFVMGGVSALIVSPCVAAPLAGALVYLSQTRDVCSAASALFALAAGMSVPLLLLGASAGALLPRAGAWMDDVKRFFGVLLLAWRSGWCSRCCRRRVAALVGRLLALLAAVLLLQRGRAQARLDMAAQDAWPRRPASSA